MTTVTAKSLRENLSLYLDKLENGEEIVIIRHSTIIGSLKPTRLATTANGRAIATMLERNQAFFRNNTGLAPKNVSAKALYHQALDETYAA